MAPDRRAVARRHLCKLRRWLATPLRELVATLKRMLGGRPAGLKARIWLDAFFNDQRSPQVPAASFQVPDILFRGASPRVVFETAHAHAHVRPPACIYQSRVPVRTYKLLPCRARKPTAGDCEGGGGRQPHLSHGARAHRPRRPGSRAIARTRPPHTLCTHGRWHGKGCKQKQADSWCGRPAGTNMRRNQWHSPVIWRLFFREAAELLAVCFVSSLSSCYICAPLSLTLVYTKVFTSRIIIVHSSTL